jgi:hypothetical protein
MISSMVRTLKTRQIGLVQTFHKISGTAGTPADSGIDRAYVLSVVDNSTGNYTINFKQAARQDLHVVGLVAITENVVLSIAAVDEDSITVKAETDAGVAADADFFLTVAHATQLSYNF